MRWRLSAGILPALVLALVLLLRFGPVAAQETPIIGYNAIHHPVVARHGMVVSADGIASRVGLEILRAGGNAVDAAVAVGFALAVTVPRAGNIGGGGFMLVYLAKEKRTVAIDYREMAPAAAGRDMFLDAAGNVDGRRSRFTHLASGVPGTVAGLLHALDRYGTMSRRQVMAPAIRLAREGFAIGFGLADSLKRAQQRLSRDADARAIFFKPDGGLYDYGETLVQRDLAATLSRIADQGAPGFYGGETARMIAAEMKAGGGLITTADLAAYRAVERQPVRGTFHGYEVVAMPPPSSGGVHIIEMLNILEGYRLRELGHNSARTIHLMAEAMKHAYADRSEYLGDPDFYTVPVARLTARDYAATIRASIDPERARPSTDIAPGRLAVYESPQTTHFSLMDRFGNAVSNTYTLNFSYGSGYVVKGAGFLLNNEMDDFSAKPGVPNAFGLLGNKANAIAPGKRPLSSMTPTLIFRDGKPVVVTGSPGGGRIINAVLQVALNVMAFDMNIAAAVAVPRIHHQWLPDVLWVEPGISPDTVRLLQSMGHHPRYSRSIGRTHSVAHDKNGFYGAADPRMPGALAIGY